MHDIHSLTHFSHFIAHLFTMYCYLLFLMDRTHPMNNFDGISVSFYLMVLSKCLKPFDFLKLSFLEQKKYCFKGTQLAARSPVPSLGLFVDLWKMSRRCPDAHVTPFSWLSCPLSPGTSVLLFPTSSDGHSFFPHLFPCSRHL